MLSSIRATCADILHVLPGMSYDRLEDMDWGQLVRWRETAVDLYKRIHGNTNG